MTHPGGAFYSAEDADSLRSPTAPHKTEGAFYIWEKKEIDSLLGDAAEGQKFLATHAEFYQSVTAQDGKATAYYCENFVCQLPTTDPAKFRERLAEKRDSE